MQWFSTFYTIGRAASYLSSIRSKYVETAKIMRLYGKVLISTIFTHRINYIPFKSCMLITFRTGCGNEIFEQDFTDS